MGKCSKGRFDPSHFLLRQVLEAKKGVTRALVRPDQLIQLELDDTGITILCVLK